MLVPLKNKEIADKWDIFKEMIRKTVPSSPLMLPDRMQRMLYAAMSDRIQLWLLYEGTGDDFYGAIITYPNTDPFSGQTSMMIYAIEMFKKVPREIRDKDLQTLKMAALSKGCTSLTTFSPRREYANALLKANSGEGEVWYYTIIPTITEVA